jgi:hypothetical protein
MTPQLALFDAEPVLPGGFRYAADLLAASEESELVARLSELPLKEFEFHGYRGKRRVASFGWHYDFAREALDGSTTCLPSCARFANGPLNSRRWIRNGFSTC